MDEPPTINIAKGLVMIDFDATILPWGPLMEERDPYPGVARQIALLHEAGYRIYIYTSRLSPTWIAHEGTTYRKQYNYVEKICARHGIHFDGITAEKLPAEVYFDDKAVYVQPGTLDRVLHKWRMEHAPAR